MLRPLVFYHASCYDGFTAAWVAHQILGDAAEYHPVNYGAALPFFALDPPRRLVYVLDFSWPRTEMECLARTADLTLLDHHKTAAEALTDLPGEPHVIFDMERSGCGLAWDYFMAGEARPLLVDYAEDRDLWRFRMEGSREVSAWLRSFPFTWEAWDRAHNALLQDRWSVIQEGAAILRFQDQMVNVMCAQRVMRVIGGHLVPVVNATVFFSEVGERLCELSPDVPFGAYYFDRLADGKRQWGLRSRGGFDCSAVAKQYGGGGHPGAAGFVTEIGWVLL